MTATLPIKKWMREHFLVSPIRNNEKKVMGPDGEEVSILLSHHAFEKVREAVVVSPPHRPKYDAIRYLRMCYSEDQIRNTRLTHNTVECQVEAGDIIGISPNQVKDDEFQNRVTFFGTDKELYEIDFSSVFYWRKPGSDEIRLTPGWAVIQIDKKVEKKINQIIHLRMEENKEPFEGTIRYVSEGPDGTKETLGVDVGDKIYFTRKMNVSIPINGEDLFLIAHSQILGTYE